MALALNGGGRRLACVDAVKDLR